jgi:hypothetical protein
MSAHPGLYGGQPEMVVPTVLDSCLSTVVLTDESLCENIRGPLELRDMDL